MNDCNPYIPFQGQQCAKNFKDIVLLNYLIGVYFSNLRNRQRQLQLYRNIFRVMPSSRCAHKITLFFQDSCYNELISILADTLSHDVQR